MKFMLLEPWKLHLDLRLCLSKYIISDVCDPLNSVCPMDTLMHLS